MGKRTILKTWPTISIFLVALATGATAAGRLIYVDADATGANDGSSWADAYNYLQDALADANSAEKPVEIRIAQGIHKPDQGKNQTLGDREATFRLINGVTLKGGFGGLGAPDPNARDLDVYEVILSGDLNGDDVEVSDPCDLLGEPTRSENSYHVVSGSGTDETAVLNGFIITAGNNAWIPLLFSGGGGMYNDSGSPTLTDCTFSGNSADEWGGGGMYNWESSPTLTNCTFTGNSADEWGGGGMYNWDSSLTLTNCTFTGNSADWGGGMYNSGNRPTLANCTFSGNTAILGGGMHNWSSSPLTTNCTFNRNSATQGGGMYHHGGTPILTNCMFWGNSDRDGIDESAQIVGDRPDLNYSCIQGWTGSYAGSGNIGDDPLFADPDNGDFHLKSQAGRYDPNAQTWVMDDVTSPCIDTGDMDGPIGLESFPNGGVINMGAYGGTADASKSYFGTPVCETIVAGDINGDCKIDFADFVMMSRHWLRDITSVPALPPPPPPVPPPKGRACFLGCTAVWIDGRILQISNVVSGQLVGETDCNLATTCLMQIEKVEEHEGTFACYDVVLETGNSISVAESHYFLTEDGRWVALQNLKAGTRLQSSKGPIGIVSVTKRPIPYVGKVYNLKVEGSDRYLVGEDAVIVRDY